MWDSMLMSVSESHVGTDAASQNTECSAAMSATVWLSDAYMYTPTITHTSISLNNIPTIVRVCMR